MGVFRARCCFSDGFVPGGRLFYDPTEARTREDSTLEYFGKMPKLKSKTEVLYLSLRPTLLYLTMCWHTTLLYCVGHRIGPGASDTRRRVDLLASVQTIASRRTPLSSRCQQVLVNFAENLGTREYFSLFSADTHPTTVTRVSAYLGSIATKKCLRPFSAVPYVTQRLTQYTNYSNAGDLIRTRGI